MKLSLHVKTGDVIYCNCDMLIALWINEDNCLQISIGVEDPSVFATLGECLLYFIFGFEALLDVRSGDEGVFVVNEAVMSFDDLGSTNFSGYYLLSDSDETGIRRIYTNIPTHRQMCNAFAAITVFYSEEELPDRVKTDSASFISDLQQHTDIWKQNHSGKDNRFDSQSFYGELFEQGTFALTCNSADDYQDMMSYLDSCGYILSKQLSPAGWNDFCRYVYCKKITTPTTNWLIIRGDKTPPDTIDNVISFSDYIKQIY